MEIHIPQPRRRTDWTLVGMVGLLLVAVSALVALQQPAVQPVSTGNEQVAGVRDAGTQAPAAGTGRAEGTASHPSGTIPTDLVICAEPTLGGPATCVTPAPSGQYALELAPGQYHVSAYTKSAPTLRGYYTELSAGLEGSRPLIVNVTAGETLTGINPDDWS